MSDIVERLRANLHKYPGFVNLSEEAANEIKSLREAVRVLGAVVEAYARKTKFLTERDVRDKDIRRCMKDVLANPTASAAVEKGGVG